MEGFLARSDLPRLLEILRAAGYRILGPQARDGAIVYDTLERVEQLPYGVRVVERPGYYRLQHDGAPARCFAWANGPQALKPLVFAPRETLWQAERERDGALRFLSIRPQTEPLAVLGVRACDLAALALLDQHFLASDFPDPHYRTRRAGLFLIAVHCTHPAETCFCASTGDGPRAERGFDLALAELDEGFIVESGSPTGERIAGQLPLAPVASAQRERAARELFQAAHCQRRRLPLAAAELASRLFARLDHPRWEEVAARCLACGNCTAVCPTCFCHAIHAEPDLEGLASAQVREWDSCFTARHSYIHGLTVRGDTRLRYRQWLTHKLGGWHEQFGRSGCVGCGRCIAWCPVGIDLTEELAAIAAP
jgi:ferredoxin